MTLVQKEINKLKRISIPNGNVARLLQIVEQISETLGRHFVQAVAHQEGQLVGVLAHRRDPDSARPVIVKMGQLIRQALDMVWPQPGGVLHNVVAGGVHSALPH